MNRKESILFSASSIGMNLLNMAANVVLIKFIDPTNMGIWNTYAAFQTYAIFLQLGVINGLNREFPFLLGKGEKDKAMRLASTAKSMAVYSTLLALGIFAIVAFTLFTTKDLGEKHYLSFGALVLIGSSEFYKNYLIVIARANKSFGSLYKAYFIQSALILGSLAIVYLYGFQGMIARFALLAISLTFLLHIFKPFNVPSKWQTPDFKELFKIGLPIFSFGYVQGLVNTFNRFVILFFANTEALGMYSPALALITAIKIIPATLAQIIYPQMSFKIGEGTSKSQLWRMVWKPFFVLSFLIIPIAIVGWFILPYLFEAFFPKYIEALFATQIILISAPITGALIGINLLNSLKNWKALSYVTAAKVILYAGLMVCSAYLLEGNKLEIISGSFVVADFVFIGFCLILLKREIEKLPIPQV